MTPGTGFPNCNEVKIFLHISFTITAKWRCACAGLFSPIIVPEAPVPIFTPDINKEKTRPGDACLTGHIKAIIYSAAHTTCIVHPGV